LIVSGTLEKWVFHSVGESAGGQLEMAAEGDLTGQSKQLSDILAKPNLSDDDKKQILDQMTELKHELAHLFSPKDKDAKWNVFDKTSNNDYFGFKLFPSDMCLLVARIEKGAGRSQWLRDPYHPAVKAGASHVDSVPWREFADLFVAHVEMLSKPPQTRLLPANAYVSSVEFPRDQSQPVQGGTCLNPHPWGYQQEWGPYMNQCQQPVFQWNDGCRHVQVFDHCTNTWGPVVWQVCVPNHHP